LRNQLSVAVMRGCYQAYRELLASDRYRRLEAAGALPQRLLWASTGTKDPTVRDGLYVEALIAPQTVNTVPEATLLAFGEHGAVEGPMFPGGPELLEPFRDAGIDVSALAATLQREGAESFVISWRSLLEQIREKSALVA
jgi:transaldolase